MERTGHRSAGWIVAAVLVGALVVPQVAEAVGSIVTIQGAGSTQKAAVTKGHQLQVAEAPQSSFRAFEASVTSTSCSVIVTAPAKSGFIARTISLSVINPLGGAIPVVALYPNGTCAGDEILATMRTDAAGTYTIPLEPGFALAAGGKIGVKVTNSAGVVVSIFGYLVPKGDVPATTPIAF